MTANLSKHKINQLPLVLFTDLVLELELVNVKIHSTVDHNNYNPSDVKCNSTIKQCFFNCTRIFNEAYNNLSPFVIISSTFTIISSTQNSLQHFTLINLVKVVGTFLYFPTNVTLARVISVKSGRNAIFPSSAQYQVQ